MVIKTFSGNLLVSNVGSGEALTLGEADSPLTGVADGLRLKVSFGILLFFLANTNQVIPTAIMTNKKAINGFIKLINGFLITPPTLNGKWSDHLSSPVSSQETQRYFQKTFDLNITLGFLGA